MGEAGSALRKVLGEKRVSLGLKRVLDVIGAAAGLIFALPAFAVIAVAINWCDGRPILFRKACVGRDGCRFYALKFRTMTTQTDPAREPLHIERDHANITPLGRILRKTALDELPQLWNILRGEMSFVGPRAWRWEYAARIESELPEFALTRLVRPGLTGLAQVYSTYYVTPRRKMRYDVMYIKRLSVLLDVKLVVMSFLITFRSDWQNQRNRRRKAIRRAAKIAVFTTPG